MAGVVVTAAWSDWERFTLTYAQVHSFLEVKSTSGWRPEAPQFPAPALLRSQPPEIHHNSR